MGLIAGLLSLMREMVSQLGDRQFLKCLYDPLRDEWDVPFVCAANAGSALGAVSSLAHGAGLNTTLDDLEKTMRERFGSGGAGVLGLGAGTSAASIAWTLRGAARGFAAGTALGGLASSSTDLSVGVS